MCMTRNIPSVSTLYFKLFNFISQLDGVQVGFCLILDLYPVLIKMSTYIWFIFLILTWFLPILDYKIEISN